MQRKKDKHLEHADENKLKLLSGISFLFGFAEALLIYVTSDYFSQQLGSHNVSAFYFIIYIVALIGLLNMHKLVKIMGKSGAFFLSFFAANLSLVCAYFHQAANLRGCFDDALYHRQLFCLDRAGRCH